MDASGFLKTILPWIGAAATGNVPALITMAASQISTAVGYDVKPEIASITKAISGATPEQLLLLKQSDQEFALKMQALGFDQILKLEELKFSDVASARNREIKSGDITTPRLLSVFAVVCFVGLIWSVLKGLEPASGMKDTLLILVGSAITVFKDVYGYYFGSSSGSRENQDALRKIKQKDSEK